ncbi:hypothetical protein SOVF_021430, partial [Spinacia oleracea]
MHTMYGIGYVQKISAIKGLKTRCNL